MRREEGIVGLGLILWGAMIRTDHNKEIYPSRSDLGAFAEHDVPCVLGWKAKGLSESFSSSISRGTDDR